MWMWQLRTWFSAGLMVGLHDLTGLVQPDQLYDFNCIEHLLIPGFGLSICEKYIKPSTHRERIPHTRAHPTHPLKHHSTNSSFVLAVIHPVQDTGPEAKRREMSSARGFLDAGCWGGWYNGRRAMLTHGLAVSPAGSQPVLRHTHAGIGDIRPAAQWNFPRDLQLPPAAPGPDLRHRQQK